MLGTAVLIPLLIIRAIGGEAVHHSSFPQSAWLAHRTVFVDFCLFFEIFSWLSKHVPMRT